MTVSPFTYRCKVNRVVDGDTLDLAMDLGFHIWIVSEHVRLSGVNTPEVFGPNAVPEGKIASLKTAEWVAARTEQLLWVSKTYHARDKYGRSLGELGYYSGDVFTTLNQYLLDAGYPKL
ncbi:MAG: thermonuclease family protein [Nitrospira sp.]|nr:thermonuclease family protein [Nitrospira sp.]